MWKHPLLVRVSNFFLIAEHRKEDRASQQWSCDSWSKQAETTTVSSIGRWPLLSARCIFLCEWSQPRGGSYSAQNCFLDCALSLGRCRSASNHLEQEFPSHVQMPLWLAIAAGALMQQVKNSWDAASHAELTFWEGAVARSSFFEWYWAITGFFLFLNKIRNTGLPQVAGRGLYLHPDSQ